MDNLRHEVDYAFTKHADVSRKTMNRNAAKTRDGKDLLLEGQMKRFYSTESDPGTVDQA